MEILPSCSCATTIVWLHHQNFIEAIQVKASMNYTRMLCTVLNKSWKLHLQYSSYMAICLPYYKPSKTNKTCWPVLDNSDGLISKVHLWAPTYGHTSFS